MMPEKFRSNLEFLLQVYGDFVHFQDPSLSM